MTQKQQNSHKQHRGITQDAYFFVYVIHALSDKMKINKINRIIWMNKKEINVLHINTHFQITFIFGKRQAPLVIQFSFRILIKWFIIFSSSTATNTKCLYYNPMYLNIEKPSLSLLSKKQNYHLQIQKSITLYINELKDLTRLTITTYLLLHNKLKVYSPKYTSQKYSADAIYLRGVDPNESTDILWLMDYFLAQNADLTKLDSILSYPLLLQIKICEEQQRINSLTKKLSFGLFGLGQGSFIESVQDNSIMIGKGSFSTIHLIRQQSTHRPYCLKLINKKHCETVGQLEYIKNQYEFLTDPNIRYHSFNKHFINLRYTIENSEWVGFVQQWGVFGNLYTWIKTIEESKIPRECWVSSAYLYFVQIALAICKLHRVGYIYRDLKPQNVILDLRGNAKLCDFGFTKKIGSSQFLTEVCGSYEYLPPELIAHQSYNKSYDLYCLGLLFYEMLSQRNPFSGITPKNIDQAKSIKIQFSPHQFEENTEDLIRCLMKEKPEQRIGYEDTADIFKHKFFIEHQQTIIAALTTDNTESQSHILLQNYSLNVLEEKIDRSESELQARVMKSPKQLKSLLSPKVTPQDFNYLKSDVKIPEKIGPRIFLK